MFLITPFNRLCFHCRQPIKVQENGEHGSVFVNNQFYHEDCFVTPLQDLAKAKCFFCDKVVDLDMDNAAYYDKHFWHTECIIAKSQKTKTKKWKEAVQTLEVSKRAAKEEKQKIEDIIKTASKNLNAYRRAADIQILKWQSESRLNDYLRQTYSVKVLPWDVFYKIYNGTYKGMETPIPAEHLLDMWTRKQKYLDKVYHQNKAKGNTFTPQGRIKYDVAILISKYDSYLKWRQEQEKLIPQETAVNDNDFLVSQTIATISKNDNKENKNIEDIADDIFG